jgi:hypothetical protein
MGFLKLFYLYFIIIGMFFMSISLHFKKSKDLKFGFFGWAENLTFKGRIYFFIGIIIAFLGAYLGT